MKLATPLEIPERIIGGIALVPLHGEAPFPMDCPHMVLGPTPRAMDVK